VSKRSDRTKIILNILQLCRKEFREVKYSALSAELCLKWGLSQRNVLELFQILQASNLIIIDEELDKVSLAEKRVVVSGK